MLKLLLFIFLTSSLFGADKVEVFATKMDTIDNTVYAKGDVNVIYKDYFISARKAKYNRDSGDLELFDDIRVTQGDSYKILGEYAKLNIKNKTREFKPFYMLEKTSNVWMSAKKGTSCDKNLDIDSGLLSGCNPNKPLWKMEFSSSDYDEKSKWINMYNARLYIYDIPVFYTPYFGYSLDDTRQSGLLMPAFGISGDEGVYFEQPIYLALQNWWDLELKPQTRSQRGAGLYTTFRFVDSKISKGSLQLGYFKEKQDYFQRKNLQNQEHFGFDFSYKNNDFINQWFTSSLEGQSSIYADVHYLNDVDYINLATNDTTRRATAQQILSRVNLFYNNDNNYFGAYFKYYQDLSKENNDATLQKLPTLQYHKYLSTFFKEHLLYNLDFQTTNIYRTQGVGALQTDLNIPLTLQTSLFDEYLNVAYKSFVYAQTSNFKGENNTTDIYNDGYYARYYNLLKASSQLTRVYDSFSHTMSLSANYIFGGNDTRNGYYKDAQVDCSVNSSDPKCDFYNISDVSEALSMSFEQYVFDSVAKQILYQKLSQNIVYQGKAESLGDLENELDYKITNAISLYNNMFFNYEENLFSKIYNKVSYTQSGISLAFSHLYQDNFKKDQSGFKRYSSYMTSTLGYTYDEHYSYRAVYNYDIEKSAKKTAEIGFLYKKRCWDFGVRYVENNRPVLSNSGDQYNSIYERFIYFTIVLKPIMQPNANSNSAFTYKLPEVYKGL